MTSAQPGSCVGHLGYFDTLVRLMLDLDSSGPRWGKDNGGNAVCSAVAVTAAVAVAASSGLAKQQSCY